MAAWPLPWFNGGALLPSTGMCRTGKRRFLVGRAALVPVLQELIRLARVSQQSPSKVAVARAYRSALSGLDPNSYSLLVRAQLDSGVSLLLAILSALN